MRSNKKVWYYNGFNRNLGFWDFVDMTQDYSIEVAIKRYREYRDLASVNENIVYHMIAANLYNQFDEGKRKPTHTQTKTGINYLGGVNNVNARSVSDFMRLRIRPLLKKYLNDKDYQKMNRWLNTSVAL
jgi:hypothetical protein